MGEGEKVFSLEEFKNRRLNKEEKTPGDIKEQAGKILSETGGDDLTNDGGEKLTQEELKQAIEEADKFSEEAVRELEKPEEQ